MTLFPDPIATSQQATAAPVSRFVGLWGSRDIPSQDHGTSCFSPRRQVVDERHASARTMLEQAVNKGKEMYRNGDERDHVQMTNDLIGKTEPGGAQPFKDVTVNTLRKRLSKFLQEEGKNNLVVGLPEYYASRR